MKISRLLMRAFLICLLGISFIGAASACTITAWQNSSGAVSPQNPNNSVPRMNGYCGLQVSDTGYVEDDSPSAESSFVGHFYFLPEFSGSGSVDIFVAYSDGAANTPAIVIRFDGSNFIIDATAIGGSTASVSAVLNSWNLVEFTWESGNPGTGNFWVNSDATSNPASATFIPGIGAIETVRLGAPNGFGGSLAGRAIFDEYVSNRTAAVGQLLYGDANLDSAVDSNDIDLVVTEYLTAGLAFGVIDCNLDGLVNAGDIDCMAAAILAGP